MLELEMLPTAALLDELMKRCSPAVFIGTKYDGEGDDRSWKNFNHCQGNLETCRGLCLELDSMLERKMVREEIERALGKEDS